MTACKDDVVDEMRSKRFMLQHETFRFMLMVREEYRLTRSCLRRL